jgi:hypothetical protein
MTDINLTDRKLEAEIAKIMAETIKINGEARWYPFIAGAGAGAAILGGLIGFIKLMFS